MAMSVRDLPHPHHGGTGEPAHWRRLGRCPRCGLKGCPGRDASAECIHVHTATGITSPGRAKGEVFADGKYVGRMTDIQMTPILDTVPERVSDWRGSVTGRENEFWLDHELSRIAA
jgi:hypothetical protein